MARARATLTAGDYAATMATLERYRRLGDAEVAAIFGEAKEKQLLARLETVPKTDLAERAQVLSLLAKAVPSNSDYAAKAQAHWRPAKSGLAASARSSSAPDARETCSIAAPAPPRSCP